MIEDDLGTGAFFTALAALPTHEPEPARAGRIRALCHSGIARRHLAKTSASTAQYACRLWLVELPLVAGVGAIFLIEVLMRAFRLYGL